MLFFPYATDAPIYHYPIATGTIVAVNIGVYAMTSMQVITGNMTLEDIKWLTLQFDGIHPLQWITHSFMHAHPFHVIVNMLFLWSFGLVIEGKVGAAIFSAIYFGTHIICGALAQSMFYVLSFAAPVVADFFAFGADNGIYVLMAMALVWAPENEMNCVLLIFIPRLGKMGGGLMTELKIVSLATGYIFIELILFFFLGFLIWQAGFHLLALFGGIALAFVMLRMDWVDCEDWDIVSRNEWLHQYPLVCSEERRQRLAQKVEIKHDAVALALATSNTASTSHASYMAARSATMSRSSSGEKTTFNPRPVAAQPGPTSLPQQQQQTAASRTTKRLGLLGRKSAEPVAAPLTPQQLAQQHPDFNRIAMLLRQAISTNSMLLAEQHFGKLQQLGLAEGLADTTLFEYVKLLAANKKYLPALNPLQLIIAHGGPMTSDATIRIAQIQLKVLHQPGEAVKTLRTIRFAGQSPDGPSLSEAQKTILARRDALLQQCGVRPPPLLAKDSPPK